MTPNYSRHGGGAHSIPHGTGDSSFCLRCVNRVIFRGRALTSVTQVQVVTHSPSDAPGRESDHHGKLVPSPRRAVQWAVVGAAPAQSCWGINRVPLPPSPFHFALFPLGQRLLGSAFPGRHTGKCSPWDLLSVPVQASADAAASVKRSAGTEVWTDRGPAASRANHKTAHLRCPGEGPATASCGGECLGQVSLFMCHYLATLSNVFLLNLIKLNFKTHSWLSCFKEDLLSARALPSLPLGGIQRAGAQFRPACRRSRCSALCPPRLEADPPL